MLPLRFSFFLSDDLVLLLVDEDEDASLLCLLTS